MHFRALIAPVCLCVSVSLAEATPAESATDGTIVGLEGEVAYFDIGMGRTLRRGTTVFILRTVTLKHPVTGERLIDHFPLGTLTVDEVGKVLSFGHLAKQISGAVKIGDVVQLRSPPLAVPFALATDATANSAAALELEITHLWTATLGRSLSERIRLFKDYIQSHPKTPFAESLWREIAFYRRVDTELKAPSTPTDSPPSEVSGPIVRGAVPTHLYMGDPLVLAIFVQSDKPVAAALAFVRRPRDLTYQRLPLVYDGNGYFRATVPPKWVAPPGVELFVEVVDRAGVATLMGSATQPTSILVEAVSAGPVSPGPGHSAVRGFFEFVDFNGFKGNDYYLLTESDFMYRVGEVLHAVRTGFGVLYGQGAAVKDLDQGLRSHEVGFNYGYLEGDLALGRVVGLAGRFLGGHTVSGHGVGAELRLRIGPEMGTNLVVGGSVMSDIGALALLQLEWDVIHNWPMSATVTVTNQPAEQDIGVRIVGQIGYRAKSWFRPTVRVGYGARNIQHGGISLGLGVVMGW